MGIIKGVTDPMVGLKKRNSGKAGMASRWGETREPGKQIRCSMSAWALALQVPEKDRRRVIDEGVSNACMKYLGTK